MARTNSLLVLAWFVLSVACVNLDLPTALLQSGGSLDSHQPSSGGTTAVNKDSQSSSGGAGGNTMPLSGGSKKPGDAPLLFDVSNDTVASGGRDAVDSPINKGGIVAVGGIQGTGGNMNSGGAASGGVGSGGVGSGGVGSGGVGSGGAASGGVGSGGVGSGGVGSGGVATGGIGTGGLVDAGYDVIPDVVNGTGGSNWPSGWSVKNISDEGDVSLAGQLVGAVKLNGDSDVTINGVKFTGQALPRSPYDLVNGDTCSPSDTTRVGAYEGFGVKAEPFTSLSTAYRSLLQNGIFNDGVASTASSTARFTLTIKGLIVGKTYLFQMWVNDSRANNLNQSNSQLYTTLSDGDKSLILRHNRTGKAGGTGQYAIVVFEATRASKNFTITGGSETATGTPLATTLLMAYQVREN